MLISAAFAANKFVGGTDAAVLGILALLPNILAPAVLIDGEAALKVFTVIPPNIDAELVGDVATAAAVPNEFPPKIFFPTIWELDHIKVSSVNSHLIELTICGFRNIWFTCVESLENRAWIVCI